MLQFIKIEKNKSLSLKILIVNRNNYRIRQAIYSQ